MTDPDFVIERLDDGSTLFHPRTEAAREAVRSGRYGADFYGGLQLDAEEPSWVGAPGPTPAEILADILRGDGYSWTWTEARPCT